MLLQSCEGFFFIYSMNQLSGFLYALFSSAAFGFIPLFVVPLQQKGMDTVSIVFYRLFSSVLATMLLLLLRRKSLRINSRQLLLFACLSFFYAVSALFLLASYQYIPSGVATTIHFLYPAFVILLSALLFKEYITRVTLLLLLLSIVGISLLSLSGVEGAINPIGLFMVLLTVFSYGSYLVLFQRSAVKKVDSLVSTFWILLFTLLFCSIAVLVIQGHLSPISNINDAVNLAFLGVIPTLVSNLFLILAIRRIGSTYTSMLGSMEALTAVVLGILFLHEHLAVFQCLGATLVLVSIALIILSQALARRLHRKDYVK